MYTRTYIFTWVELVLSARPPCVYHVRIRTCTYVRAHVYRLSLRFLPGLLVDIMYVYMYVRTYVRTYVHMYVKVELVLSARPPCVRTYIRTCILLATDLFTR